jgi:hypothetical protein
LTTLQRINPAAGTSPRIAWFAMAVFGAGVCLGFPAPALPGFGEGNFPRLPDMVNFLAGGLLLIGVVRQEPLHRAIIMVAFVCALCFGWTIAETFYLSSTSEPPIQRVLFRWILSCCSMYWLIVMMERREQRLLILFGLLAGLGLSATTVVYDFATFNPESMPVEQLVLLAIYNGKEIHDFIYRASGIFGHPNGAAGCLLIGVPIIIGLIEEKILPRASMLAAVALIGVVFYLTKSRGAMLTAGALVVLWAVCFTSKSEKLILFLLIALCLAVTAAASPSFLSGTFADRLLDFESISINAGDRWWTMSTSLDLILKHPFGMGSSYGHQLSVATGTDATHNAYLELGLMAGLPLMLFVIGGLCSTASLLASPHRPVEAWAAAYLIGIFFFETYFLQVNMPIYALWLLWRPRQPQGTSAAGSDMFVPALRR